MTTDPTSETAHRSPTADEWPLLDVLREHRYDYEARTSKPDDPGWNACTCGWEGYWSSFHPHVAQYLAITSEARVAAARAEALQPVLDLLDDEWYDEPPTRTYPEGRRLYRWPADLRAQLRAVVSREPGEGDTALNDLDDVAAEFGVDLTEDGGTE